MADINGKIRLLRGTLASFAAGAFSRCLRIITDSANGETLATWNGTEWIQMARQLADGSLKSQGLKVNGAPCIESDRKAIFAGLTNEAVTLNTIPKRCASGEADSCFSDDGATAMCSRPLTLNGATRMPWASGHPANQFGGISAFWETPFLTRFARGIYYDGAVFRVADGGNTPATISLSSDGTFSFSADATAPVAGAVATAITNRFSVTKFGRANAWSTEPVLSGISSNVSTLTYTNSTTPTSIIDGGARTIAAQRWGNAGAVWSAIAMGTIQWTNSHTLRIEVLLGATVIADSGAISMSTISAGSIWSLSLFGTIRTEGASGTLQIDGVFRCTEAGGLVAIKGFPVGTVSPAAIDTTVSNTFNVRVTAGTASTGNILTTRTFQFEGN